MATAVQVESLWNGLTDNSGQPLAAGKVYTYSAGTSTPVSLYTASDKSTSATNPLILDGNGKAQVWADGRYKFVVKTSADVTLYTLDNLLYGFDDTTVLYGGTSTGSANVQVVSVPATVTSYSNGQTVSFVAGYTNSGATTLQFNSLSAVNLVKGPIPSSLQAGDLIAGQLYTAIYHGGTFRLQDYPSVADIQRSRTQLITDVAGTNAITGKVTPSLTGYETGAVYRFKAANANNGPVTINIDSLGAKTLQYNNAALVAGEVAQNVWHEVVYDGTQFQLLNPAFSASTRTLPTTVAQIQDGAVIYGGTSTGSANAQAISLSPDITAYTAGQRFIFKAGYTNTGATTLAVDSISPAKAIQRFGVALVGGEITLNDMVEVVYDGTQFQLCNSTPAPLFVDRTNTRVGVGTTAPESSFHVTGALATTPTSVGVHLGTESNYSGINLTNSSGGYIDFGAASSDFGGRIRYVNSTNNLEFYGNGSSVKLEIGGNTTFRNANIYIASTAIASGAGNYPLKWATSGVVTYDGSSRLIKENIIDNPYGLESILALRPRKYHRSDDKRDEVGFIADEVEAVVPELVSYGPKSIYTKNEDDTEIIPSNVSYDRITSVLCKAIQELNAKVEALQARVAELEVA